ncbi:MAG: hypothetical protein KKH91_05055 [Elusimicrobia bacterium]|nr:hypothetical protein [Elusimicrobiota bacterium]MBU2614863.1 hypothetical protein [Elusimicrobiota bacterium]
MKKLLSLLFLLFVPYAPVKAAPLVPPVYLCELPNINEYDILANSGWDGNWYVGYNVCWLEKISNIPESPTEFYRKAYIGAKLGRAKVRPVEGKSSWENEPIPGDIYIGISSTSAWKSNSRYFLASSLDLPVEGDLMNAQSGTGEARWFWAEVPIEQINLKGPNYIALWSPTDYFTARDTAPILCGGRGAKGAETNTWLNNEIEGAPPIDPADSLKTPISVFEPAIAMKLIPAKTEQEIKIQIFEVKDGKKGTPNKTIVASIAGDQIEKTWLEYATLTSAYQRTGKLLYNLPWTFTLNPEKLPEEKIFVRVAAEDVWGNLGYSQNIEMIVK